MDNYRAMCRYLLLFSLYPGTCFYSVFIQVLTSTQVFVQVFIQVFIQVLTSMQSLFRMDDSFVSRKLLQKCNSYPGDCQCDESDDESFIHDNDRLCDIDEHCSLLTKTCDANSPRQRLKTSKSEPYRLFDLEIHPAGFCGKGPHRHPLQLYSYFEVPEYLRVNPHIHHGYRALLPFAGCMRSLFEWNNESVNIWSHLVGFVMFFSFMLWDNFVYIPFTGGSFSDHMIISLTLFCYQFCMICSSGYHLFLCHSEQAAQRWFALDLTGISVGLLGCYLPAIHYAYYCIPFWYHVYFITIGFLFATVLYWQTKPLFATDRFQTPRMLLFCGLTVYGVLPVIHWIVLQGGFGSYFVQLIANKVIMMYAICLLAFVFYFTRFPEVCYPGHFDYVGCSHQMWHMLIVIAFVWWHHTGLEMLKLQVKIPCYKI